MGEVIPFRRRDHYDVMPDDQLARLVTAVAKVDVSIHRLLTPEEYEELDMSILSDKIAIEMVSRGIEF